MNHDIIYIATDRVYSGRMSLYGGYNLFPNIERIAGHGTVFDNAQAAAASTLMCHSCEWTGLYPWQLHDETNVPYHQRLYETQMFSSENVFTDLVEQGYDVNIVFVNKPGKYFETYKQTAGIWGKKGVKIHLVDDWDINPSNSRKTHLKTSLKILEQSRKEGKKCFVWMKIHGFYKELDPRTMTVGDPLLRYVDYAGQPRVTRDDAWNCIVDEVIGEILEETGHLKDENAPEIIFASDHGAFQGEYNMRDYGFHLTQEIMHVPMISSYSVDDKTGKLNLSAGKNPKRIKDLFSMRQIRNLLTKREYEREEMIFAETLYPGQVSNVSRKKESFFKIAALDKRYKYIYQPWGFNGKSENPTEMLFDTFYDRSEKINLANFDGQYEDVARGTKAIKKDVIMRYHSDVHYCRDSNNYFENLEYKLKKNPKTKITENLSVGTGWNEINRIRQKFRDTCRSVWSDTGRGEYFKL